MAYDNTNRGALFKNDKSDNPKRPDHKGPLNINGEEGTLSAWWAKDGSQLRKDKDGNPYLSVKWESKGERDEKPPPEDRVAADQQDRDDDIPF